MLVICVWVGLYYSSVVLVCATVGKYEEGSVSFGRMCLPSISIEPETITSPLTL